MGIEILYEDNHVIAVNKEPGILSQGDKSGDKTLIDIVKEYIKKRYNKPGNVFLGPVHRLDKPVSGIMLFARTSKAAKRLHEEFMQSGVRKYYLAVIKEKDGFSQPRGRWIELSQFMERVNDRSIITGSGTEKSLSVRLRYCAVGSSRGHTLLLIHLITGKKHQIRAQLFSMGCPVVGDRKYDSREKMTDGSICLHSFSIIFSHPTKKIPMELFTGIPERFREKMDISDEILDKVKDMIKKS